VAYTQMWDLRYWGTEVGGGGADVGSCEHSDEPSCTIQGGDVLAM
jgi:hypothetical protein